MKVGHEAQLAVLRSRAFVLQTLAMLALDLALLPERDWKGVLKSRNINPLSIGSTAPVNLAIAATFGVDPGSENAQEAEEAKGTLKRNVPATEWLVARIKAMTPTELLAITSDEAGVDKIVGLIKEAGGVTGAAKLQRDKSDLDPDQREYHIDINSEAGAEQLIARGKKAIRNLAGVTTDEDISFKITAVIGGKEVVIPINNDVMEAISSPILTSMAAVDPTVAALGEMLQFGKLIEEKTTSIPTNRDDDPEDPATDKRLATRHFVLRSDRTVLISPILAEDDLSPVIVVKPTNFSVFPSDEPNWELATKDRRQLEANIADPKNRCYFVASQGDTEGTQGVARLVLTADAAMEGSPAGKEIRVLLQTLKSAQGNLPLDVASDRFAELRFLPFHVAVEVQVGAFPGMPGSAASVASFVFGPEGATILDGNAAPIFTLNRRHLSLGEPASVLDYLRFFCAHVRGDEGPFRTVESVGDIGFRPRTRERTRKNVADLLHPLSLVSLDQDEDAGTAAVEAMVLYSDTLFRSTFSISLKDGVTDMVDDQPVMQALPVRSMVFRDNYRAPVGGSMDGSRTER